MCIVYFKNCNHTMMTIDTHAVDTSVVTSAEETEHETTETDTATVSSTKETENNSIEADAVAIVSTEETGDVTTKATGAVLISSEEMENADIHHVTDYSHVYRKINGKNRKESNSNREYLKESTEQYHLPPSATSAKTIAKVIINDLKNSGEYDEVKYLFRKGSGFFTDRWSNWHITSCRCDLNGIQHLISFPPSSQAEESFLSLIHI